MKQEFNITINGKKHSGHVEPRVLLVQYLREELNLTGTHIGCDTSSCGACNVLVNGQAVKSCTMLALQANGAQVTTIEGLASNGKMHPVQEAFKENHGLQCGFCTPGVVITAVDLLSRNASPSESEIRHALEGNFCRCTGYHNIVKSIQHAANAMQL